MDVFVFAAGVLAFVTGLAHSVLGEIMIFRNLRRGGIVPDKAPPPLQLRNIQIVWASWHAITVFGWAFAAVLVQLSMVGSDDSLRSTVYWAVIAANAGASALVLFGTRGRHPGWVALLLVAVLVQIAR